MSNNIQIYDQICFKYVKKMCKYVYNMLFICPNICENNVQISLEIGGKYGLQQPESSQRKPKVAKGSEKEVRGSQKEAKKCQQEAKKSRKKLEGSHISPIINQISVNLVSYQICFPGRKNYRKVSQRILNIRPIFALVMVLYQKYAI